MGVSITNGFVKVKPKYRRTVSNHYGNGYDCPEGYELLKNKAECNSFQKGSDQLAYNDKGDHNTIGSVVDVHHELSPRYCSFSSRNGVGQIS